MFISIKKSLMLRRALIFVMALSCTGLVAMDDPPSGVIPNVPNVKYSCNESFHCALPCNEQTGEASCVEYHYIYPSPLRCSYTGNPQHSCTPVLVVCAIKKRFDFSYCVNSMQCEHSWPAGQENVLGYGCDQ